MTPPSRRWRTVYDRDGVEIYRFWEGHHELSTAPIPLAVVNFAPRLAFGLRLGEQSSRSLWYDRALAILFAEKSLTAMLRGTITLTNGVGGVPLPPTSTCSTSGSSGWMQSSARLRPPCVAAVSVLFGNNRVCRLSFGRGD
ncbi:MAG: hypothetical protein H6668_00600 [Ardenticatenaceae bacterium]|nr:hypothetical protein [Ardenticatenaceae bacterium]